MIAVTNAGTGHVDVTSRDPSLLEGAVVHVEHIDRRDTVGVTDAEPYRLPDPRLAARVRLHIGRSAPCSVYLGRLDPLDPATGRGQLKATRAAAAVASRLFAMGMPSASCACRVCPRLGRWRS